MAYNRYFPAKKYRWHVTPLRELKEMLESRRKNQFDNIILITGSRGIGKSTITGKVLFQFPDFNPFENIVYTKEAMFKLAKNKNGYIWGDEAIINVAKGNVMTRANKMLHELFTISRNNFNIIFLLLPFVEDFDSKILQYCSMWLHVDSRGLAVMLLPANQGIFGRANWDLIQMKRIFDEFRKENQNLSHIPFWIFQNFRGYVKFGKLTDQQEKIVNEIKDLRKNENLDKDMKEEVKIEVKELTNYQKYASMKIAEMVMKGEVRDLEVFKMQCNDLKVDFDITLKKCDSILKRNNIQKTTKGLLKSYEKTDSLIKF